MSTINRMTLTKAYKRWKMLSDQNDPAERQVISELSEKLGVSMITATLLHNRGYSDPEKAEAFLNCDDTVFHDPFLLNDIEPALERLDRAVRNHEHIAIYGDYDVDGVTSVTLLYLYLCSLHADAEYYIPNRGKQGYGVSKAALDSLHERGVKLIITVDTGVTACDECDYAKALGMEMIITDHHECQKSLPAAVAVINPHRPDSTYPYTDLAGVGVIFKVICAHAERRANEEGRDVVRAIKELCYKYADLVAIGTIADVMPLTDENRLIVKLGLSFMNSSTRLGLDALLRESKQARKKITTTTIGFNIAPRLNAAGRIDSASKAVELLLSEDSATATARAKLLCSMNDKRKEEESIIAKEAEELIRTQCDLEKDHFIVLTKDNWRQGVIGVVVSRLTETYGLPAILISFDGIGDQKPQGSDLGKGSGRSIRGLNLARTLQRCSDILQESGGHELAAGLTVRRDKIDELRKRLNVYAAEDLGQNDIIPELEADYIITPAEISEDLVNEAARLEPYGIKNPIPQFVMQDLTVMRMMDLKEGMHTKLFLRARDGSEYEGVWFGKSMADLDFVVNQHVDVLFQLTINEYRGQSNLQMVIQDIHYPDRVMKEFEYWSARYREIAAGGAIGPDESVIPTRDDLGRIYSFLKKTSQYMRRQMAELTILEGVNLSCDSDFEKMNYAKFKFGMAVLNELKVIQTEDSETGRITFKMPYHAQRATVEKSEILKRLKGQSRVQP
ncbi:MAG: single-stranded-DNA-specific exonuclease RecJ [Clostridia bacterium]|nr:single-stranded-DNA-specific exonuclease RecJ [Clostridia bacterium]